MFTLLKGSQHGVVQYTMGKVASQVLQRYSGPLLFRFPDCHTNFKNWIIPPLALLVDDIMQELTADTHLGFTDRVYDWNRRRKEYDVGDVPLVSDMVVNSDTFYKKLILGEVMTLATIFDNKEIQRAYGQRLLDAFLGNTHVIAVGNDTSRYSQLFHEVVSPDLHAPVYMCAIRKVEPCLRLLNYGEAAGG